MKLTGIPINFTVKSIKTKGNLKFKIFKVRWASDDTEIKEVVFKIKPWASPGNDGFQAAFYQNCWDTVGAEMIACCFSKILQII